MCGLRKACHDQRNRIRTTANKPSSVLVQLSLVSFCSEPCPPFPRISPIASAGPRPGSVSSPPRRSRRARRSSAISGRCSIRRTRSMTTSTTSICSKSTIAGPSTVRCARTSPAISTTPAGRNAESDVNSRKRKVVIRAIKTIEPGEEINYDYGTDYFKIFLKPIGCKCDHCEKKRKKQRAEARAESCG